MDKDISYVAFESVCARFERIIKRQWLVIILLVIVLVTYVSVDMWQDSQYEDVVTTTTETYTSDATDGGVAIANGDGEVSVNG